MFNSQTFRLNNKEKMIIISKQIFFYLTLCYFLIIEKIFSHNHKYNNHDIERFSIFSKILTPIELILFI
jgi:hypothetical protein